MASSFLSWTVAHSGLGPTGPRRPQLDRRRIRPRGHQVGAQSRYPEQFMEISKILVVHQKMFSPRPAYFYPRLIYPAYQTHKQMIKRYSSASEALMTSETKETASNFQVGNEKVGVLLLNLGGPETLEDVQPFLFNLFADPDIIRLPRLFRFLQKPLAQFVSIVRAPKSKEGYASIGGGSPLRQITNTQAEELRKALCEKNVPAKVYVGMRYWHPFTEEAIEQIKSDGITKLVVLPLYPQFSISTSGSSLRLLESIFREDEYLVNMQHTVIPSWYQREGYIKAMANLIEMELENFEIRQEVMIFFSAHGVPLAYVEEAGDPYKAEMEECVDLIMEELEKRQITNAYKLAYQTDLQLGRECGHELFLLMRRLCSTQIGSTQWTVKLVLLLIVIHVIWLHPLLVLNLFLVDGSLLLSFILMALLITERLGWW